MMPQRKMLQSRTGGKIMGVVIDMELAGKNVMRGGGFSGPPTRGISGADGGDGMEARIAKLESDVGHIQSDLREMKGDVKDIKKDAREDFRILFGALIVVALGLALIMAKGFGWFN